MSATLGLDTLNPATLLSRRFRSSEIPSLVGRTAIVTGGSAGIGFPTALALARAGARVLIISSTPEHGQQAEAEINAAVQEGSPAAQGSVKWYGCQLADIKAVDTLAKELAKEDRLDILVHNAGVGQAPSQVVECGLENHFAINNLAAYVLTLRLLPLLQRTAAAAPPASVRIVMQSSEMHRVAPSDTKFASVEEINEERDGSVAYGRSKLGLVLLARQLAKRYLTPPANIGADAQPIIAISVHPGTVDTDIQEAWKETYGGVVGSALDAVTRTLGKSADEGAEAGLWAATSPEINAENWREYQGNYYKEARGTPGTESAQGKDDQLGDQFWELCREQTKAILGEDLH